MRISTSLVLGHVNSKLSGAASIPKKFQRVLVSLSQLFGKWHETSTASKDGEIEPAVVYHHISFIWFGKLVFFLDGANHQFWGSTMCEHTRSCRKGIQFVWTTARISHSYLVYNEPLLPMVNQTCWLSIDNCAGFTRKSLPQQHWFMTILDHKHWPCFNHHH